MVVVERCGVVQGHRLLLFFVFLCSAPGDAKLIPRYLDGRPAQLGRPDVFLFIFVSPVGIGVVDALEVDSRVASHPYFYHICSSFETIGRGRDFEVSYLSRNGA